MLIYIYHFIHRLIWTSTNQSPYQIDSLIKPTRYDTYSFERIIQWSTRCFSKISYMSRSNAEHFTRNRHRSEIIIYCSLHWDVYTHVYKLSRNNPYEGGTRGMSKPSVIIRQEGYFINRG